VSSIYIRMEGSRRGRSQPAGIGRSDHTPWVDQIVGLGQQNWWIHEKELIELLGIKATHESTCAETIGEVLASAMVRGVSIEQQTYGRKGGTAPLTNWVFIGQNSLRVKLKQQLELVGFVIGATASKDASTGMVTTATEAYRLRRANSWQSFYVDGEKRLTLPERQDVLFVLKKYASFFPSIERIDLGNRLSTGIIDSARIAIGDAVRSSHQWPRTARKRPPTNAITPPTNNLGRRRLEYDDGLANDPSMPTESSSGIKNPTTIGSQDSITG
jgi:hypothetical protein